MAVTQVNHTYVLTAAADAVAQPLKLQSLRWRGTGLTVGQNLIIRTKSGGELLVDHFVEATTEDVEFLVQSRWVAGIYIDTIPAGGGGKIIAVAE